MSSLGKFRIDRLVREIIDLGQQQAKTSFPNPNRIGCPVGSILKAMAYRDTSLDPDDLPITHVNSCSPCFSEYMTHRRTKHRTRTMRLVIGSMAAVVLLGLCFTLIRSYLWVEDLPSVSQVPRRSSDPVKPGSEQSMPMKVTIDLARFSPTRSEESAPTSHHIALPAKLIRARVLMPVGSGPGEYAIRLVSSENVAIVATNSVARMEDGLATLDLEMPLGPLPGTTLTLMIRPAGLRWQSFPIVVAK